MYPPTKTENIQSFNYKNRMSMKKKFICPICGFVFEGAEAPERCPQCKQIVTWKEVDESAGITFACEHEIGVAKDTDEQMKKDLNAS